MTHSVSAKPGVCSTRSMLSMVNSPNSPVLRSVASRTRWKASTTVHTIGMPMTAMVTSSVGATSARPARDSRRRSVNGRRFGGAGRSRVGERPVSGAWSVN